MNKIKLIVLMLFVSLGVLAQEAVETTQNKTRTESKSLYSKKGDYVLPQAGDISIGVNALPILEYMGNVFGKTASNPLNITQTNIYGRYFLSDDMALRVNFDMHRNKDVDRTFVQDDKEAMTNPTSQAKVKDVHKYKDEDFTLMVGVQKYRGYGRLRGFAGALGGYGLEVDKHKYTYGNNITEINQKPTVADASVWTGNNRLLNSTKRTNHLFLGGVVGVEYYFAPKMCIGIEGHLMGHFSFDGREQSQSETWGGTEVITLDKTDNDAPDNYSDIDTDYGTATGVRPSAGVYFMFTF